MKRLAMVGGLVTLGAMALIGNFFAERQHPLIRVDAAGPQYSVDELWDAAEIVAVVVPTGSQRERWNNASNTIWESVSDSGKLPMIFRDEEVAVVIVLKGNPPGSLTIRNIGGLADGIQFEYTGLFDLKTTQQYLVFLETVQTPTEEGSEEAISFVAQGQGLWSSLAGGFRNLDGRTLTLDELTSS